jgi:hypothetical protein
MMLPAAKKMKLKDGNSKENITIAGHPLPDATATGESPRAEKRKKNDSPHVNQPRKIEEERDAHPTSPAARHAAAPRKSARAWTLEENTLLIRLVKEYESKGMKTNWRVISDGFRAKGFVRTGDQCCQRYIRVLCPELKKGHWTAEEDAILLEHIGDNAEKSWRNVANALCRSDIQCRYRWQQLRLKRENSLKKDGIDPANPNSSSSPDSSKLLTTSANLLGGVDERQKSQEDIALKKESVDAKSARSFQIQKAPHLKNDFHFKSNANNNADDDDADADADDADADADDDDDDDDDNRVDEDNDEDDDDDVKDDKDVKNDNDDDDDDDDDDDYHTRIRQDCKRK